MVSEKAQKVDLESPHLAFKKVKVNPGIPTAALLQQYELENQKYQQTIVPPIASVAPSMENIALSADMEEQSQSPEAGKDTKASSEENVGNDPFSFLKFIKQYPETNEFVYLVSVSQGTSTYNPYNLKIVDYFSIDTSSPDGYYTMSAKVGLI